MSKIIDDSEKKSRLVAAAMLRLQSIQRATCLNPANPDSKATAAQLEILKEFGTVKHQYIRGGNQSSKTTIFARCISWVVERNHPYWTLPSEWEKEPLLIVIAGRTGKQIEDSLLPRITSFLSSGTYKVVRIGNIVQRIEMINGDRIIFQSLENPEMARERLQSYTAHIAWVDELPPTLGILSELHRRVQAKNGYFLSSFTPLTPNYEIQQYIDTVEVSQPGYARVYRLNMLDNPIYATPERRAELLQSVEKLPEKMRNAVLYGDWVSGDENVYDVDGATLFRELPDTYLPNAWRHVVSVDPAMESATGLTVWAEDPRQGDWYCINSEHLTGYKTPVEWVKAVQKRTSMYNVIRRVSDVAPWFTSTAYSELKVIYSAIQNKAGRKQELIANLQKLLGTRLFIVPSKCAPLLRELQDCRWSTRTTPNGTPTIVAGQKYHCLDSAQYFADAIPRPLVETKGLMGDGIKADNWYEWLYKANDKRLKMRSESSADKQKGGKRSSVTRISRTSRGW